MSSAKRLASYRKAETIQDKVSILTARHVHDLGRKPKQYELDQLEQLSLLKILFEQVLEKMATGYEPKRELVGLVNQYNQLAEKYFGEKSAKNQVKEDTKSIWD